MKLALYKGTRPGWQGLFSRLVRWWCRGPYSHCELVFSDGMSGSSSFIDGGVRLKKIEYSPEKWDFLELPKFSEGHARWWFMNYSGSKYDTLGVLRFGFGPLSDNRKRFFCSESIMAALGFEDAWRFDPCAIKTILAIAIKK